METLYKAHRPSVIRRQRKEAVKSFFKYTGYVILFWVAAYICLWASYLTATQVL